MAVRNNPFKPIAKAIPAPLKNKYFIVLAAFFLWMVFFDKHGFFDNWGLNQKVQQMKADQEYYEAKIQKAKDDKKDVDLDPEKFSRENFFMKKDDEDVFIFEVVQEE